MDPSWVHCCRATTGTPPLPCIDQSIPRPFQILEGGAIDPTFSEGVVRSRCRQANGVELVAATIVGKCSPLGGKWLVGRPLGWQGDSKSRIRGGAPDLTFFFLYLQDLFLGIRVLLLAVSVLQSLVALASLGLGLQSLCSPAPQALVSC